MKESIQITFEVGVPENQFESAMNTLILGLRDYKSFMEEGKKFLDYDKYKVQNNFIIDRMINNMKNFYEERWKYMKELLLGWFYKPYFQLNFIDSLMIVFEFVIVGVLIIFIAILIERIVSKIKDIVRRFNKWNTEK